MELTFCDCSGESVEKVLARTAYQTLDIAEDLLRCVPYPQLVPGVAGHRGARGTNLPDEKAFEITQGGGGGGDAPHTKPSTLPKTFCGTLVWGLESPVYIGESDERQG